MGELKQIPLAGSGSPKSSARPFLPVLLGYLVVAFIAAALVLVASSTIARPSSKATSSSVRLYKAVLTTTTTATHNWGSPLQPSIDLQNGLGITNTKVDAEEYASKIAYLAARGSSSGGSPSTDIPPPAAFIRPLDLTTCNVPGKIFVVGFMKSGTTSITAALEKAGIKTVHWKFGSQFVGHAMAISAALGEKLLSRLPPGTQAVTQMDVLIGCNKGTGSNCTYNAWPQLTMVPMLDQQYPCSKFILNHRRMEDHIESIDGWKNLRNRLVNNHVPFLPMGKGSTDDELMEWIERHYSYVREYFQDRPQDFLDFDIDRGEKENAEILSRFLGIDKLDFGQENVGKWG